jgi:hypothetical protein
MIVEDWQTRPVVGKQFLSVNRRFEYLLGEDKANGLN